MLGPDCNKAGAVGNAECSRTRLRVTSVSQIMACLGHDEFLCRALQLDHTRWEVSGSVVRWVGVDGVCRNGPEDGCFEMLARKSRCMHSPMPSPPRPLADTRWRSFVFEAGACVPQAQLDMQQVPQTGFHKPQAATSSSPSGAPLFHPTAYTCASA